MSTRRRWLTAVHCSLILLIIFSGCGLFGRKKEFEFKDPLKLRVAVMPFDDSAGLGGQALGRRISEQLTKRLSQSEGLVVLPQERIEEYLRANEVPTPLTQNTATLVGRMLGLNAVVLGSTAELSQIQKRTGWLRWFSFLSSKHDFVASVLVAKVVDVENGTILTADTSTGETMIGVVDEDELLGRQSINVDRSLINASLDNSVDMLAKTIIKAMAKSRWHGYIHTVDGDTAVMSGGEDVGMRAGYQFLVFSMGEKVTNAAGQIYIIPGPLKARLEAVRVLAETTEVRVVSGLVDRGDVARYDSPKDD